MLGDPDHVPGATEMDSDRWLDLVVAILASWRVTHLLALEDGPGDVVVRIRLRLGASRLGGLMDCFLCLSLWVALVPAICMARGGLDLFAIWFAVSGGVCLVERFGQARSESNGAPR
jgi:hypothetical protein